MNDAYIKSKQVFSFLPIFLIGFFFLFYTGCSNPTSGTYDNNETLSVVRGLVQKGKFLNGEIKAQSISNKGERVGEVIKSTINANGEYNLKLKLKGLYLFTAKGKFFNEYTGKKSTEEVELYALVDVGAKNFSKKINLNLFTSLEYSRVIELMKKGKSYQDALVETRDSMKRFFGVEKNINTFELNIYDMNGTLKEENKNLLLFSATLLKVIDKSLTTKESEKSSKNSQKFSMNPIQTLYHAFGVDGKPDGSAQKIYEDIVDDDEASTFGVAIGNLGLHETQAPVKDWVVPGATGTTFRLFDFKLSKIKANGHWQDYTNQTAFFVDGLVNPELYFTYNSSSDVSLNFKLNIYAVTAHGSMLIGSNRAGHITLLDETHNVGSRSGEITIVLRDTVKTFLHNAYLRGDTVKFRAVSDVALNLISYVEVKTDVLPKFVGISNTLNINGKLVDTNTVRFLSKADNSCNEIDEAIDATQLRQYAKYNMNIKWKPSENWSEATGNLENGCVRLDYNSSMSHFDLTLLEKNVRLVTVDSVSSTIGGLSVETDLRDMQIKPDGRLVKVVSGHSDTNASFTVTLPRGISLHLDLDNYGISPLGTSSLRCYSRTMNISSDWDTLVLKNLDLLSAKVHGVYLHGEKNPFYVSTNNSIRLNSEGLHFTNILAKYIHSGNPTQIISNDIVFSQPHGTFDISINEHGIQTNTPIHFGAVTNVQTDFPYTKMTQNGFDVTLVNGEILPVNTTGVGSYTFGYSSECKEQSCSDEGSPSFLSYRLNSSGYQIAKDGGFMSPVNIAGKKIAWGSQKNSNYVFERDSDSKGVIYVPGFAINANQPKDLISTLLGSRDVDSSTKKLSTAHILKSPFSKKGNGLFAGLNVGSLYLDNTNSDPLTSLNGTTMNIVVGGTVPLSLTSNAKSKYYIRPSGITGVFNGSLAQANEELFIYGYPMTFKRFAFSQVANKLNPKTLIDGAIKVVGDGDFKVDYSSLALDCTGALNGGLVEESDCDASPSINCNQTLSKWKTKTAFVSVDFEKNANDVCSDKTLKIGHVLDVRALKKPLGLVTNWTPQGKPENATVSGSSSNFLDGDEHDASSKGFAVALDSGTQLTNGGWYKFTGAFGLPFWGMQPVDLGLTNKSTITRDLTRVMPRNVLNQSTYASDKAQKFMASYQWGSTGFGFSLPVYYERDEGNKESVFIGKKLGIDLGVMSANAGINYIKPNDTKISFGASADFEAMGKLKIKIDLNDPKSIKKIDDTLDTFGIGGNPLYNTIGKVLDPLHEAEEYADKGLLLGMEELGVKALEQGANEVGVDPFEIVADNMVKIHTLPIQAIDMTEEYVLEKFDNKIGSASGFVNTMLSSANEVTADVREQSKQQALHIIDTVLGEFNSLDALKNQLHDVQHTLALMNVANSWELLDSKINNIIPKGGCTSETLLNKSDLFKPVFILKNNIMSINTKIQAIPMGTVKSFAKKIDSKINYDSSNMINSFEKTQRISNSLVSEIQIAQGKVDHEMNNFCGQANTIRAEIKKLVDKTAELTAIVSKLQDYIGKVETQLNNIDNFEGNLTNFRTALNDFNTSIVIDENTRTTFNTLGSQKILSSIEDFKVDGKSISDLKIELKNTLKAIPQPTADELRHIVVTKILDSEPIANVRIAMNEAVSPIMDEVRSTVVDLFASVNGAIYDIFDKLSAKANKALAEATSAVNALPIKSGKMDGYALISGDELDRLHIGAEWAVDSGDKDSSYSFNGALDMQRWGAGGKAGCGGSTSTDGNMDVKISTRDIDLSLGGKEMSIDELYFGFTLAHALPVGIMGGIESKAGFDFNKFQLYDMKLLVGIGAIETYLGAKSSAIFDVYQLNAAFLVGKTCGDEIIKKLDPEVGEFITLPNNVFKGVYIRGGASFPIWDNGCALTVGVTADLGAWVLIPGTYGGLVGGGAYGKALCIASIKGNVKAMFQKSGDNMKFRGEGWGAAGAGWCSPSKWYSVAKSRRDSWCGTGDAQFGAEYNDGWKLLDISTDAVF